MEKLIQKYKSMRLSQIIDYDKFNKVAISHHSTKIEGSTLTEVETAVLLVDGLTPKGKPLQDTYMVTDHYNALNFVIEQANNNRAVSLDLIQEINAKVLKNTGKIINTALGTFDESQGVFRKWNVTAGDARFPNYNKVELLTKKLVEQIVQRMDKNLSITEKVNLCFDAHFNLVSIHPFGDGNGRTSRLLMNYIQSYYELPLAIVNSTDKVAYIEALRETRKKENIHIFREFMKKQYEHFLNEEIKKYEVKKGIKFKLIF